MRAGLWMLGAAQCSSSGNGLPNWGITGFIQMSGKSYGKAIFPWPQYLSCVFCDSMLSLRTGSSWFHCDFYPREDFRADSLIVFWWNKTLQTLTHSLNNWVFSRICLRAGEGTTGMKLVPLKPRQCLLYCATGHTQLPVGLQGWNSGSFQAIQPKQS